MNRYKFKLAPCVLALLFSGASWSVAPIEGKSGAPAPVARVTQPAPVSWQVKSRHGVWMVVCPEKAEAASDRPSVDPAVDRVSSCRVMQTLDVKVGNTQQRLLSLSLTQQEDSLSGEFVVPFGLDLQQGLVLKVDEGPSMSARFSTCLPTGCVVRVLFPKEASQSLLAGRKLQLAFRALGSERLTVTEVSSVGLASAAETLLARQ